RERGVDPFETFRGHPDRGNIGLGVHPVPAGERTGVPGTTVWERVSGLFRDPVEGLLRALSHQGEGPLRLARVRRGDEHERIVPLEGELGAEGRDGRLVETVAGELVRMDQTLEAGGPGAIGELPPETLGVRPGPPKK